MRMLFKATVALAAAAVAAGLTTPALAGNPASTNYKGSFDGNIAYQACSTDPGSHVASGTWRVNVQKNGDATARFVIYVDGAPHVAFTAPMQGDTLASGETFADTLLTAAGPLRVSLSDETFVYRIAPYDFSAFGGPVCSSVTYYGTLDTE